MIYNDLSSKKQGIIQAIRDMTGVDATKERITTFVNMALNDLDGLGLIIDYVYQSEDSRWDDVPTAKSNIINGTSRYPINDSFLFMYKVVYTDSDGEKQVLKPLKRGEEPLTLESGKPTAYWIVGSEINLNTIPDEDVTDGLILDYARVSRDFDPDETDVTPGMNSIFHDFLIKQASSYISDVDTLSNAGALRNIAEKENKKVKRLIMTRNIRLKKPRLSAKHNRIMR